MKQKHTLILITCLLTASLVLALGTVTFSWYQSRISSDKGVEIPADGFIVVGFDENPEIAAGVLEPAVAKPNAIRDNRYFDVMKLYDENDANPSYIEKKATSYTHTEVITFYEKPNSQEEIESYLFMLTAQAYVMLGEEAHNVNTNREINFNISAVVDYENIEDPTEPIKITPEVKFEIKGSATITLSIEIWLALPDELCDPNLISNDLFFEFGIKAEPVLKKA